MLYLVKRDGIDLGRLQVSEIADAYLDFVQRMRGLNLSIAGEYLVMAATLVHLKSLELLPRLPTPLEEEAPDPRAEFAQRLADYQRYRAAAELLAKRPRLGRDQFVRPERATGRGELETAYDVFGLLDIYREMIREADAPEPVVQFEELVHLDMGDSVLALLDVLESMGGRGELTALLSKLNSRAARVVTFIGVLEMLKLGWVSVVQKIHLGSIELTANETRQSVDMRALRGWVEEPA